MSDAVGLTIPAQPLEPVWLLDSTGQLWSLKDLATSSWEKIASNVKTFSLNTEGFVWIVTTDNKIHYAMLSHVGQVTCVTLSTAFNFKHIASVPYSLSKITGIHANLVKCLALGVGGDSRLYGATLNNLSSAITAGTSYQQVAIGLNGDVWCVSGAIDAGTVSRLNVTTLTETSMSPTSLVFNSIVLKVRQIAAGSGALWVATGPTASSFLYRVSGTNYSSNTSIGSSLSPVSCFSQPLKYIAVSPRGRLWVIEGNNVLSYNDTWPVTLQSVALPPLPSGVTPRKVETGAVFASEVERLAHMTSLGFSEPDPSAEQIAILKTRITTDAANLASTTFATAYGAVLGILESIDGKKADGSSIPAAQILALDKITLPYSNADDEAAIRGVFTAAVAGLFEKRSANTLTAVKALLEKVSGVAYQKVFNAAGYAKIADDIKVIGDELTAAAALTDQINKVKTRIATDSTKLKSINFADAYTAVAAILSAIDNKTLFVDKIVAPYPADWATAVTGPFTTAVEGLFAKRTGITIQQRDALATLIDKIALPAYQVLFDSTVYTNEERAAHIGSLAIERPLLSMVPTNKKLSDTDADGRIKILKDAMAAATGKTFDASTQTKFSQMAKYVFEESPLAPDRNTQLSVLQTFLGTVKAHTLFNANAYQTIDRDITIIASLIIIDQSLNEIRTATATTDAIVVAKMQSVLTEMGKAFAVLSIDSVTKVNCALALQNMFNKRPAISPDTTALLTSIQGVLAAAQAKSAWYDTTKYTTLAGDIQKIIAEIASIEGLKTVKDALARCTGVFIDDVKTLHNVLSAVKPETLAVVEPATKADFTNAIKTIVKNRANALLADITITKNLLDGTGYPAWSKLFDSATYGQSDLDVAKRSVALEKSLLEATDKMKAVNDAAVGTVDDTAKTTFIKTVKQIFEKRPAVSVATKSTLEAIIKLLSTEFFTNKEYIEKYQEASTGFSKTTPAQDAETIRKEMDSSPELAIEKGTQGSMLLAEQATGLFTTTPATTAAAAPVTPSPVLSDDKQLIDIQIPSVKSAKSFKDKVAAATKIITWAGTKKFASSSQNKFYKDVIESLYNQYKKMSTKDKNTYKSTIKGLLNLVKAKSKTKLLTDAQKNKVSTWVSAIK
jgi:hypothetical protein